MILMIKTLPKLGFSAVDTEYISSVFTTWGVKFNTIITSIPNGLIISLIPNMVKDYTEKNMIAVNSNFNKCLKIILLIIAPLAIFLSGMSTSLWNVFYGANTYGPSIIKYSLIITIMDCLYIVINSLLQSLNKQKVIYVSVIVGIVANLITDIPLMYLFNSLRIPAYYGAITATLIGTSTSCLISIIYLTRKMEFNYKETIKSIPRFIISLIILIPMIYIFNKILPIQNSGRMMQIVNLAVSGIACGGIYLLINFKHIKVLLPEKLLKKLKLTN
jgi:O-antigen/teichoic acid export membrane protein